ncbi:MAG: GGDEF domain-containing protein [Candidatus Thiodiazotropha sp.]
MSLDPDDVWVDAIKGLNHLPQRKKRRLYRLAVVITVGISYLLDTLLLSLFAAVDAISFQAPLYYGLGGLGHVILFGSLQISGFSERYRNRHMTVWQMLYALGVQMMGMFLAPQITPFFLAMVFVIFSFGTLRIGFKEALGVWFVSILAIAVTILFKPHVQLTLLHGGHVEYLLVTVSFALILLRVIGLGYYAQAMRLRIFELSRALENEATHDPLTGIHNRRGLDVLLQKQLSLYTRKGVPCSLAMIDIDHFKLINDDCGHATGDRILQQLVRELQQTLRDTDNLVRYGGEEFLLVMSATALPDALRLSERIRAEIEKVRWEVLPAGQVITISIGLTEFCEGDSVEDALSRSDAALYQAKRSGRNRVITHNGRFTEIPEIV